MKYRSGQSDLVVFDRLSVTIAAGERVAIIGPSGAGKSTLLHLLGGLDRPASGRIFFDDTELFALGEDQLAAFRNRTVGFVWQMHALLPEFSAEENVALPLRIAGAAAPESLAQARERLAEVGLAQRAWHRAGELSGGEQQRVALARALVTHPRVLLADEPTGNLDQRTGDSVADLLDRLQAAHRFTTILVTHNLDFAARCDRVLQLGEGTLSEWRPAGDAGTRSGRGGVTGQHV